MKWFEIPGSMSAEERGGGGTLRLLMVCAAMLVRD